MTGRGLEAADAVVESALACSHADECVVVVEDLADANVRFANNVTTTNGVRRSRRVSVVSITGEGDERRAGVSSQSGGVDVVELVAASEAEAGGAEPAEDASPLEHGRESPDFSEPPGDTGLGVFASLLDELSEALGRARSGDRLLSGFATHEVATIYLGTSTGTRLRHVEGTGALELVERAVDGSASTWAGVGTPDFADVSLSALDERLAARLALSAHRIELEPGRYEVIMPPDAVADLVLEIEFAASGREAEDGGSVFSGHGGGTRVGETLTEVPFDLYGDPSAAGLESAPFVVTTASGADTSVFDNGCAVEPVHWIRSGTLERLRYHRAGARRAGAAFSPPTDNLLLSLPGAEASLDDLIAHTERGLLLTCLWYIREVDRSNLLLTGLTRDGIFLVEHGEVVGAVNNFRFNESPLDLLRRTIEVGRTERALSREWHEWANRTAMPSLRVAEFNMSSVSPAS